MAHPNNLRFGEADWAIDEEDDATLAGIEDAVKAADEDKVKPQEEVRKLLPQWISKFSTPNPR